MKSKQGKQKGRHSQSQAMERMVKFVCDRVVVFEVHRCEYAQPVANREDACDVFMPRDRKFCKCGRKAMCFFKDPQQRAWTLTQKQSLDASVSRLELQRMIAHDRLRPLFQKFNGLCRDVLQAYAARRRLRYGEDIVLSVKGGNVFAAYLSGLLSTARNAAPAAEWQGLTAVSDLDFEVYLKHATPSRVAEVSKLITTVLYFVRGWLLQEKYADAPTEADGDLRELLKATDDALAVRVNPMGVSSDSVVLLKTPQGVDASDADSQEPSALARASAARDCERGCAMLYMPVPCVLRYRDKGELQWVMPSQKTNFPVSYNRTLVSNEHSDVILLRLRRAVQVDIATSGEPHKKCRLTCHAEVIDVTVSGEGDAKHLLMKQHPSAKWFEAMSGFHVLSLYGLFADLMITLFTDSNHPYPWTVYKYEKRVARAVWTSTMMALTGVGADGADCPSLSAADVVADLRSMARAPTKMTKSSWWALERMSEHLRPHAAPATRESKTFFAEVSRVCTAVADTVARSDFDVPLRGREQNALPRPSSHGLLATRGGNALVWAVGDSAAATRET